MTLLGIDTSTSAARACVLRADGERSSRAARPAAGSDRRARERADARGRGRDGPGGRRLATTSTRSRSASGPGTFTGLRVESRRPAPWPRANGLPLRRVSSLAALAAGIDAPLRLPLIDARRGEVFGALYEAERQLWAPFAAPPEELVAAPAGRADSRPLAAGDGSVRFREVLEDGRIQVRPTTPRSTWFARCTSAAWARARRTSPRRPCCPDYLRDPDAKPQP